MTLNEEGEIVDPQVHDAELVRMEFDIRSVSIFILRCPTESKTWCSGWQILVGCRSRPTTPKMSSIKSLLRPI